MVNNINEEAIIESAKSISACEEAIKNLKRQYKELFEKYEKDGSRELAKDIVDILIDIKKNKDDIKQYKRDINANVEELSKPQEQ